MASQTPAPHAGPGEPDQAAALAFDVFARDCPSRPVLTDLTGRWGALVMTALMERPDRFNALRRRIDGVSEKMLAQALQSLERDGFVHREVLSVMPHRVEYRLTDLGATTAAKLFELIAHLEAHMPDVMAAQQRHDQGSSTR
jgi:DNA-binding HxlR family transcriptional regulator